MDPPNPESQNSAHARRARSGLRGKLLRSHLTVAMIGLLALLIALVVTMRLRVNAARLAEVRAPTVQASMQVRAGVQRSLASLRGWVLLGDSAFSDERELAWNEEIEPAVRDLQRLSVNGTSSKNRQQLAEVQQQLTELKEAQWWIQDVAGTPGNEPARIHLQQSVQPVTDTLLAAVSAAIDMEKTANDGEKSPLLLNMADLRFALSDSQTLLNTFADKAITADKLTFQSQLAKADASLTVIVNAIDTLTPEQRALFRLMQNELVAYRTLADQVIAARESDRWNVAFYRLENEAVPIARDVTELLTTMTERQNKLMQDDATQVSSISRIATIVSLLLIAGMTIAAILFSLRGARRLSEPILALSSATTELEAGALRDDIAVTSDDELGDLTVSFNRMRASMEQASQALVRREAESRTIIASSPVALILANRDGDIVLLNQQTENLFGYTQDDLDRLLIHNPARVLTFSDPA